jgi:hypothetical protein
MLARNVIFSAALLTFTATAAPASDQAPDFHRYSVPVYGGARAAPDFSGPDKQYLTYQTAIRAGFCYNPIAAGHYTVVSAGCGAGCVLYWYGDVRTGKIMTFPIGGENFPSLTLASDPGSRLVMAKWDDAQNGACTLRNYLLTGSQFLRVGPDRANRSSCEAI